MREIFKLAVLFGCYVSDSVTGEGGDALTARRRASLHSGWTSQQPTAPSEFGNTADNCANERLG